VAERLQGVLPSSHDVWQGFVFMADTGSCLLERSLVHASRVSTRTPTALPAPDVPCPAPTQLRNAIFHNQQEINGTVPLRHAARGPKGGYKSKKKAQQTTPHTTPPPLHRLLLTRVRLGEQAGIVLHQKLHQLRLRPHVRELARRVGRAQDGRCKQRKRGVSVSYQSSPQKLGKKITYVRTPHPSWRESSCWSRC
jgi:hypothetical protein